MDEIKTVYPEGQLSVTDLKHDVGKNTTPPVETNVLEVKTANEWIEEAKNKPIPLRCSGLILEVRLPIGSPISVPRSFARRKAGIINIYFIALRV
jgi:hypothetical protein